MKAKNLSRILRGLADPAIANHSQRFFKTGKGEYGEGDRFLGIRVPVLRQQARRHKEMALDEILRVLKSSYHEERLCALLLLVENIDVVVKRRGRPFISAIWTIRDISITGIWLIARHIIL